MSEAVNRYYQADARKRYNYLLERFTMIAEAGLALPRGSGQPERDRDWRDKIFECLKMRDEQQQEVRVWLSKMNYWKYVYKKMNLELPFWPGTEIEIADDVRRKCHGIQPWYVLMGLINQRTHTQEIVMTEKIEGFHAQISGLGLKGKTGDTDMYQYCDAVLRSEIEAISKHLVEEDLGVGHNQILNIRGELVFDGKEGICEDDAIVYDKKLDKDGMQAYNKAETNGYSNLRRLWTRQENANKFIIYDAYVSEQNQYSQMERLEQVRKALDSLMERQVILPRLKRVKIVDYCNMAREQCEIKEGDSKLRQCGIKEALEFAAKRLTWSEGLVLEITEWGKHSLTFEWRRKVKIKDWITVDAVDDRMKVWSSNVNRDGNKGWDNAKGLSLGTLANEESRSGSGKKKKHDHAQLLLFFNTSIARTVSGFDLARYKDELRQTPKQRQDLRPDEEPQGYKEIEDAGKDMESGGEGSEAGMASELEEEEAGAAGAPAGMKEDEGREAGAAEDKQPMHMEAQKGAEAGAAEGQKRARLGPGPSRLVRTFSRHIGSKGKPHSADSMPGHDADRPIEFESSAEEDIELPDSQETQMPGNSKQNAYDVDTQASMEDNLSADVRRFVFIV